MTPAPDRRQTRTRTEEAAATIPSTWVALAHEVRMGTPSVATPAQRAAFTLANLILDASESEGPTHDR